MAKNNVESLNDVLRVTVGLVPKTQRDMEYLQAEMGMTKADIVNIAMNTFAYMQRQSRAGKEWAVRDKSTHDVEVVRFTWQLDDEDEPRTLGE